MAERYGVAPRGEALAYLAHPLLGPRLIVCTTLVHAVRDRSLHATLGHPDDLKFRSAMTLGAEVAPELRVFDEALKKFGAGEQERMTLVMLGGVVRR